MTLPITWKRRPSHRWTDRAFRNEIALVFGEWAKTRNWIAALHIEEFYPTRDISISATGQTRPGAPTLRCTATVDPKFGFARFELGIAFPQGPDTTPSEFERLTQEIQRYFVISMRNHRNVSTT